MSLQIGAVAPDFELLADDGRSIKLSDYRGQQLILFFYPKADTPGCTTQACGLRDNYPQIQAADGAVLGISPDLPEALAAWRRKIDIPYPLLSDPNHAVADLYGVWGDKKFWGQTYEGIIRSHFVIDPNGVLADVQVKISPKDSVSAAVKLVVG